jgi:hypothetical protein
MWRLALDQNFNLDLWAGVVQRYKEPDLDAVRLLTVGLATTPDDQMLDWTARENRILLTHDISTVPPLAYARLAAGLPMPGVIIVSTDAPYQTIISDLVLFLSASTYQEWAGRVEYLPYR